MPASDNRPASALQPPLPAAPPRARDAALSPGIVEVVAFHCAPPWLKLERALRQYDDHYAMSAASSDIMRAAPTTYAHAPLVCQI